MSPPQLRTSHLILACLILCVLLRASPIVAKQHLPSSSPRRHTSHAHDSAAYRQARKAGEAIGTGSGGQSAEDEGGKKMIKKILGKGRKLSKGFASVRGGGVGTGFGYIRREPTTDGEAGEEKRQQTGFDMEALISEIMALDDEVVNTTVTSSSSTASTSAVSTSPNTSESETITSTSPASSALSSGASDGSFTSVTAEASDATTEAVAATSTVVVVETTTVPTTESESSTITIGPSSESVTSVSPTYVLTSETVTSVDSATESWSSTTAAEPTVIATTEEIISSSATEVDIIPTSSSGLTTDLPTITFPATSDVSTSSSDIPTLTTTETSTDVTAVPTPESTAVNTQVVTSSPSSEAVQESTSSSQAEVAFITTSAVVEAVPTSSVSTLETDLTQVISFTSDAPASTEAAPVVVTSAATSLEAVPTTSSGADAPFTVTAIQGVSSSPIASAIVTSAQSVMVAPTPTTVLVESAVSSTVSTEENVPTSSASPAPSTADSVATTLEEATTASAAQITVPISSETLAEGGATTSQEAASSSVVQEQPSYTSTSSDAIPTIAETSVFQFSTVPVTQPVASAPIESATSEPAATVETTGFTTIDTTLYASAPQTTVPTSAEFVTSTEDAVSTQVMYGSKKQQPVFWDTGWWHTVPFERGVIVAGQTESVRTGGAMGKRGGLRARAIGAVAAPSQSESASGSEGGAHSGTGVSSEGTASSSVTETTVLSDTAGLPVTGATGDGKQSGGSESTTTSATLSASPDLTLGQESITTNPGAATSTTGMMTALTSSAGATEMTTASSQSTTAITSSSESSLTIFQAGVAPPGNVTNASSPGLVPSDTGSGMTGFSETRGSAETTSSQQTTESPVTTGAEGALTIFDAGVAPPGSTTVTGVQGSGGPSGGPASSWSSSFTETTAVAESTVPSHSTTGSVSGSESGSGTGTGQTGGSAGPNGVTAVTGATTGALQHGTGLGGNQASDTTIASTTAVLQAGVTRPGQTITYPSTGHETSARNDSGIASYGSAFSGSSPVTDTNGAATQTKLTAASTTFTLYSEYTTYGVLRTSTFIGTGLARSTFTFPHTGTGPITASQSATTSALSSTTPKTGSHTGIPTTTLGHGTTGNGSFETTDASDTIPTATFALPTTTLGHGFNATGAGTTLAFTDSHTTGGVFQTTGPSNTSIPAITTFGTGPADTAWTTTTTGYIPPSTPNSTMFTSGTGTSGMTHSHVTVTAATTFATGTPPLIQPGSSSTDPTLSSSTSATAASQTEANPTTATAGPATTSGNDITSSQTFGPTTIPTAPVFSLTRSSTAPTEASSFTEGLSTVSTDPFQRPTTMSTALPLTASTATTALSTDPRESVGITETTSEISRPTFQPTLGADNSSTTQLTYDPSVLTTAQSSSFTYSASDSATGYTSSTSTTDDAYTPTQTYLIHASSTAAASTSATSTASQTDTTSALDLGSMGTPSTASPMPSTATIASDVPTIIVPASETAASSTGTAAPAATSSATTLISIVLNSDTYPWMFLVNNSDATSQLFVNFPVMISDALNIDDGDVQTYALQAYSPASVNGESTALLTKWLGYIPSAQVNNLAQYIKTPSSPLYTQSGIPGQLALQIDSSYPLVGAGTTSTGTTQSSATSAPSSSATKRRDAIIGVCVGVGGILWMALIFWIYRRVKRQHDQNLHKRLSERYSQYGVGGAMAGGRLPEGRHSRTSSLAASEIDARPSSFYANPDENEPSMRERRQTYATNPSGRSQYSDGSNGEVSPRPIGSNWFRGSVGSQNALSHVPENPFADIVHRSYLDHGPDPRVAGWRRSPQPPSGRPINKKLIGNPTLQANSLEFTEQGLR